MSEFIRNFYSQLQLSSDSGYDRPSIWEIDTLANIFYSCFPAVVIFFVEAENVSFRKLGKKCEYEGSCTPTSAYLFTLITISGILSGLVYWLKTREIYYAVSIKILSIFLLIMIAIFMLMCESDFKWMNKSIASNYKDPLIVHKYPYEKGFCQFLFNILSMIPYEITQKVVLLLVITGEPIRTFICAVIAYIFLAILTGINGRKVGKEHSKNVSNIIWSSMEIKVQFS